VRYLVAIFGRIGVGDHQADVMPDHDERTADPEGVAQQAADVLRHGPLVITTERTRRVAGAGIV
jgi:hypothetical protein